MNLNLTSNQSSPARGSHADAPQNFAPLLVHIGFHKAGSTWLQKDLFNRPELGFTDKTSEPRQHIIVRIVMPDPLCFDPAEVTSHYAPAIDAARTAGLTLALSHERLSGHPSSGGRDRCLIAERLHSVFPDARILMVFREQQSLIQSMYNQHITAGGVESLRRYLAGPGPDRLRRPAFAFEFYEFDRLIQFYRRLFGPERILALPLELLQARPAEFAGRIQAFCGRVPVPPPPATPRNVRRPQLMQFVQRPLNMLFSHSDLSPGALLNIPLFRKRFGKLRPLFDWISPPFVDRWLQERQRCAIAEIVGDRYAESNRRTEEMIGFPLAEFGYRL